MFRCGMLANLPQQARNTVVARLREAMAAGDEQAAEIIDRCYIEEQQRRRQARVALDAKWELEKSVIDDQETLVQSIAVANGIYTLGYNQKYVLRVSEVKAGALLQLLLALNSKTNVEYSLEDDVSIEEIKRQLNLANLGPLLELDLRHNREANNSGAISPIKSSDSVTLVTSGVDMGREWFTMDGVHVSPAQGPAYNGTFRRIVEGEFKREAIRSISPTLCTISPQSMTGLLASPETTPESSKSTAVAPSIQANPAKHLQPTRQLLGGERSISPETWQRAQQVGLVVSDKYEGAITTFELENASCSEEQNCSTWITAIPVEATDKDILGSICEGDVFAYNKNSSVPGKHQFSAAKVVFKCRSAAENFLRRATNNGVFVKGQRVVVVWNRNRVLPRHSKDKQTRVLEIVGPSAMNADEIEDYFHHILKFTLVERTEAMLDNGSKKVQFVFGSVRGQSSVAYKAFMTRIGGTDLEAKYTVSFGKDPCDQTNQTL